MRSPFVLALRPERDEPVFLQIARAIARDIKRGRLGRDAPLPGSRSLARSLGVHRNTVLAAYDELVAQGYLVTSPARGTFVAPAMPEATPASLPRATRPGFALRAPFDERLATPAWAPRRRDVLMLAGGLPDVRLVPVDEIARALRRSLRRHGRRVLSYADPRGEPSLRRALAAMVAARRGVAAGEDQVLVARGSQMGLDLCARLLVRPGDVVAVEAWGYAPAWGALRLAGARLAPLPVDAHGVDVDALARLLARTKVAAVYVTPHHQFPTTVTLSAPRRARLLELCRAHRVPILEDDYDHELTYEGRPVLPLASEDRAGIVLYIATLSKILAPGLRVGFVVAPHAVIERLAALRMHVDRQGDHATEAAIAELVEDGAVERHARRLQRACRARRDAMVEALERTLGDTLAFEVPRGGMAVWARSRVEVEGWAARALDAGVGFQTARSFALDGRRRRFVRLGFASVDEREIAEAVRRMKRSVIA